MRCPERGGGNIAKNTIIESKGCQEGGGGGGGNFEKKTIIESMGCQEGKRAGGGVFLLEVQYSVLKSLISTCVLSYVGSR